MNYRPKNKNLTRKEIKEIKRAEGELRNAAYKNLPESEKIERNGQEKYDKGWS